MSSPISARREGGILEVTLDRPTEGGTIALVQDGDQIVIDADLNSITLDVTQQELQQRRDQWKAPQLKFDRGVLYKYARTVASASKGCVTDEF